MERRRALKLLGGGMAALAGGKAVDNVLIGYGSVTGTNLREQNLGALVDESLTRGVRRTDVREHQLLLKDDFLEIKGGGETRSTYQYTKLSRSAARDIDEQYGLDGLVTAGVPVVQQLHAGEYEIVAAEYGSFFERVRSAEQESAAVELLRSADRVEPSVVERFADADPAVPEPVVEGLVEGFREHSSYDVPRYVAGSVQDNVLFGAMELRDPLREDVDFRTLLAADGTGMFCYEFTNRSIEALHAVPARMQRAPVFAGSVWDERHKHVYTAIGSVVREDGDLLVPVTFVDYTHSTLYDDFRVRDLLGNGLDAYNSRHRATEIYW